MVGERNTVNEPGAEYRPSAINLRASDWELLRWVADARASKEGGRSSVSKVVESLIDAQRKDLETEASEVRNPFRRRR